MMLVTTHDTATPAGCYFLLLWCLFACLVLIVQQSPPPPALLPKLIVILSAVILHLFFCVYRESKRILLAWPILVFFKDKPSLQYTIHSSGNVHGTNAFSLLSRLLLRILIPADSTAYTILLYSSTSTHNLQRKKVRTNFFPRKEPRA